MVRGLRTVVCNMLLCCLRVTAAYWCRGVSRGLTGKPAAELAPASPNRGGEDRQLMQALAYDALGGQILLVPHEILQAVIGFLRDELAQIRQPKRPQLGGRLLCLSNKATVSVTRI